MANRKPDDSSHYNGIYEEYFMDQLSLGKIKPFDLERLFLRVFREGEKKGYQLGQKDGYYLAVRDLDDFNKKESKE